MVLMACGVMNRVYATETSSPIPLTLPTPLKPAAIVPAEDTVATAPVEQQGNQEKATEVVPVTTWKGSLMFLPSELEAIEAALAIAASERGSSVATKTNMDFIMVLRAAANIQDHAQCFVVTQGKRNLILNINTILAADKNNFVVGSTFLYGF